MLCRYGSLLKAFSRTADTVFPNLFPQLVAVQSVARVLHQLRALLQVELAGRIRARS